MVIYLLLGNICKASQRTWRKLLDYPPTTPSSTPTNDSINSRRSWWKCHPFFSALTLAHILVLDKRHQRWPAISVDDGPNFLIWGHTRDLDKLKEKRKLERKRREMSFWGLMTILPSGDDSRAGTKNASFLYSTERKIGNFKTFSNQDFCLPNVLQ
jgi:hypothetical protein